MYVITNESKVMKGQSGDAAIVKTLKKSMFKTFSGNKLFEKRLRIKCT